MVEQEVTESGKEFQIAGLADLKRFKYTETLLYGWLVVMGQYRSQCYNRIMLYFL